MNKRSTSSLAASPSSPAKKRVKVRWTAEEDEALRQRVSGLDIVDIQWRAVGLEIGKTSKQCRERWCNVLDPTLVRRPFSDEELKQLLEAHKKHGSRWSFIAKTYFPGRPENSVKNAFYAARRREARRSRRAPAAPATGGTSSLPSLPTKPLAPAPAPLPRSPLPSAAPASPVTKKVSASPAMSEATLSAPSTGSPTPSSCGSAGGSTGAAEASSSPRPVSPPTLSLSAPSRPVIIDPVALLAEVASRMEQIEAARALCLA